MDGLKKFHVDVKMDDNSRWISLRGDLPENSRPSNIWFMLDEAEFVDFAKVSMERSFSDGVHRLITSGDYVVFYNFSTGDISHRKDKIGSLTINYFQTNFPTQARKAILRLARKVWKQLAEKREADPDNKWRYTEVRIDIPQSAIDRWNRLYGCGKGTVVVEMTPECEKLLAEEMQEPNQEKGCSLSDVLEFIKAAPLNTTCSVFDVAKVRLRTDNMGTGKGGYYFELYDRKGRYMYNGGIIDHGNEGNHRWSSHT